MGKGVKPPVHFRSAFEGGDLAGFNACAAGIVLSPTRW
jgi:hypothetical protein